MGEATFPPFYGEAYIWHDGVTTPLGYPKGGLNSRGNALNNRGDVCGDYVIAGQTGPGAVRHACLWSNGQAIDLGVFSPFERSVAMDLNDHRQVVGSCHTSTGGGEGFIWQNGVMANLNDLIPPNANVQVKLAKAINNSGQIGADGMDLTDGREVALRLTPIAPPPGDCDCNGVVNVDDLMAVIREWGPAIPTTTANFDLDNDVDMDDLLTVINMWGTISSPPASR
jgi:probable HAF family extracellular repeat protein